MIGVSGVTVDDRCQRCKRMLQGDAVIIYVTVDVRASALWADVTNIQIRS